MLKTEVKIIDLFTLLREINDGKIRIPEFQREFVWDRHSIVGLLESIYNGLPIGTIYFLHSESTLFNSSAFDYAVQETNPEYPIDYIIDGTQRLRTLYYCLYVKDDNKPSEFNIGFDPKRKKFINMLIKTKPKYIIELTALFSSKRFMDALIKLSKLKDSDSLVKEVNNLYFAFQSYQIPVISIANTSTDKVVDIFQLLNTTGKSLSRNEITNAVNQNLIQKAKGAKFELYDSTNGQFRFRLKAGNGEIILSSEAYQSKAGASNGIESVKRNAPDDQRYERKTGSNNQPYFVLKAGNGEPLGRSELYSSNSAMENGIESVKKNALTARVEDLT